jgi:hypothetical protein
VSQRLQTAKVCAFGVRHVWGFEEWQSALIGDESWLSVRVSLGERRSSCWRGVEQ